MTDADTARRRADELVSPLSRLSPSPQGSGGILVDLAVDDEVTAEAVGRLGMEYLSVGVDGAALDVPGLIGTMGGRPVAAVSVGDALSRVEDLGRYLGDLHALCASLGVPLLVASPNVTHLDVAAKLLIGRWDETQSGTLSSAYVRHFSDRSLRSTMAANGWRELSAQDLTSDDSDQHFPADAATLERTTPLGALLCGVREMAGTGAHADLLVRLYQATEGPVGNDAVADALDALFLTVLLRTQGRRNATLQEALLCLAAQTCDDFDVLLLLHDADASAADAIRVAVSRFEEAFSNRVRVVEVSGGGRCRPLNEGALRARGKYITTLDDDDLVFANWVETFRDAANSSPGHVVRTAVATQRVEARDGEWAGQDGYEVVDRPRLVFALDFDHVDHILDNRTPNNGYAFPRSLVTDMGLRWDESLPVLEDWDHLLTSASICGVAGVPRVTALLRWWDAGEDSKSVHTPELWKETRGRVIEKHDASPLLLDRGAFARLRTRLIDGDVAAEYAARLEDDIRRLSAELESADKAVKNETSARESAVAAVEEMRSSRSWRVTAGLRAARGVAQKAKQLRQ